VLQRNMSRQARLNSLSDSELLERLSTLVERHRKLDAEVVAHIAEVDERKLYLGQACSSMFAYCTELLHFSEAEAYLRIAVARASRSFPVLLAMLGDGRLHLSGIAKLAPHLDADNVEAATGRAAHMSKRIRLCLAPGLRGGLNSGVREAKPSSVHVPTCRRECASCLLKYAQAPAQNNCVQTELLHASRCKWSRRRAGKSQRRHGCQRR
jgi:hypothetical protein